MSSLLKYFILLIVIIAAGTAIKLATPSFITDTTNNAIIYFLAHIHALFVALPKTDAALFACIRAFADFLQFVAVVIIILWITHFQAS